MKRTLLLSALLLSGCAPNWPGPGGSSAAAPADALSCAANEMGRLGYHLQGPTHGNVVLGEKEMHDRARRSLGRLTASVNRDPRGGTRLHVDAERWEERSPSGAGGSAPHLPPNIGDVLERPRPGHPGQAGRDTLGTRRRRPAGWKRAPSAEVHDDARRVLHACAHPRTSA